MYTYDNSIDPDLQVVLELQVLLDFRVLQDCFIILVVFALQFTNLFSSLIVKLLPNQA